MHINFTAILEIIIGVLFWKVFPGMIGRGEAANVISTVMKIIGVLLVVVGVFNFIVALF